MDVDPRELSYVASPTVYDHVCGQIRTFTIVGTWWDPSSLSHRLMGRAWELGRPFLFHFPQNWWPPFSRPCGDFPGNQTECTFYKWVLDPPDYQLHWQGKGNPVDLLVFLFVINFYDYKGRGLLSIVHILIPIYLSCTVNNMIFILSHVSDNFITFNL